MSQTFSKKVEDFKCENCGFDVSGNGYTNHCPKCLWSKHVDIHPGDRLSKCGGMMKPISVESKNGEYVITHSCVICGHNKNNKTSPEDDFDQIIKVSKLPLTS